VKGLTRRGLETKDWTGVLEIVSERIKKYGCEGTKESGDDGRVVVVLKQTLAQGTSPRLYGLRVFNALYSMCAFLMRSFDVKCVDVRTGFVKLVSLL
jgi:hypothetical protein